MRLTLPQKNREILKRRGGDRKVKLAILSFNMGSSLWMVILA
jgi:hypothetical protein